MDGNGAQVANLGSIGAERYAGSMANGQHNVDEVAMAAT